MVKNLPLSAGEVGSIPGLGTKIPCAMHVATKSTCCKEEPAKTKKNKKKKTQNNTEMDLMKNQDISLPSRVNYPRYREQMNRNISLGASCVYLYRLHLAPQPHQSFPLSSLSFTPSLSFLPFLPSSNVY